MGIIRSKKVLPLELIDVRAKDEREAKLMTLTSTMFQPEQYWFYFVFIF